MQITYKKGINIRILSSEGEFIKNATLEPKTIVIFDQFKNLGGIRFSLHAAIAPTACMTKDTEITELDNVLSLGDFLIKWGIDVNSIEEDGVPRWVYFEENNKPIIKTRFEIFHESFRGIRCKFIEFFQQVWKKKHIIVV